MRKIISFILISLCLVLISCSKTETTDKNPGDVNNPVNTENTENKDESSEEIVNVSKIYEGSAKLDENTIILKNGLKDETLSASSNDTYDYDDSAINSKVRNLLLFCKDNFYNINYYVNYGEDYFIYRLKDGKSELVLEMPAKRLFCVDGKLYFILQSYKIYEFKDMKEGNILCYDPLSGEVSIVCDVEADSMSVYDDGIYYTVIKNITYNDDGSFSEKVGLYYYSFTTKNIEEINDPFKSHVKWKDYFLTLEPTYSETDKAYSLTLKLDTLDKSNSIIIAEKYKYGNYTIAHNKLYYYHGNNFIVHDLETNDELKIPIFSGYNTQDFTYANGMIYFSGLYQYDPKTEILRNIPSYRDQRESVYELYTDGTNLYGICGIQDIKYGVMRRIDIMNNPEGFITNTSSTDGVSYEVGRYVFKALPMGKQ